MGRKLLRIFKWVNPNRRKTCKYMKLVGPTKQKIKTLEKLCSWGKKIQRGLFNSVKTREYVRVGDHDDSVMDSKPSSIPRGQLAVHVEEPEGDTRRVLVPVLFLNHPLFGKLLEDAEKVYGFDHPGRITIPCPLDEFEKVRTRIRSGNGKCVNWS